ncbi:MAG: hypothetical protein JAY97_16410 [Candidatus Thiodiazotropha sp. 'RUGA']|nr:hypothetical protein [Candidatus Thiodiazotropha sp. 'RUGA']
MMATYKYYLLLILLILTSFACGEGSGGDAVSGGDDVSVGDNDDDVTDGQNINSGLTGRLYTSEEYEGYVIDLSNGNVSQMPEKRWPDTGNYNNLGIFYDSQPNHNGSELLLHVNNCYQEYNGNHGDFDCMGIFDAAGNLITNRGVISDGIREVRLSRNGNYVAAVYADESLIGPLAHLVIYDRNYTEIISESIMRRVSRGDDSRNFARTLDWSPNGEIVYAYAKTIFITSPYSADGSALLTLPDSDAPISNRFPLPATPKVSPDGTKVAFRYVSEANLYQATATIWVMNIDGTDLHQLANAPEALYQMFNNLTWSPDGEYILSQVGGFGNDPIIGGAQNKLYAIPSNSRNVALNCDGIDGVICVRTYFKNPGNLTNIFHPYGSEFEWIE